MTVILFIALVALAILLERVFSRVRRLEDHVSNLRDRLIGLDPGLTAEQRTQRADERDRARGRAEERRPPATVVREQPLAAPSPPAIALPSNRRLNRRHRNQ